MRSYVIAALIGGTALVAGCSLFEAPRIESPWSGRQVTEAELAREHEQRVKDLELEDAAERERIDADARAAQREFDDAVASLDLANQAELLELRSRFAERADEIDMSRLKQRRELQTEASVIAAKLEYGKSELERAQARADLFGGLLSTVAGNPATSAALSAVPIVGPILTAVLGYGVASSSSRRRKQAEDLAWEEAKREAREEQARNDKTWDESAAIAQQQALLAALLKKTEATVTA